MSGAHLSCPDLPPSLKLRRPRAFVARRSLGGDRIRASINLHKMRFSKGMDCRVKPGNDADHAFRAIRPPSTGITAPVRYEAAGRHRLKVMWATSSGSP